LSDLHNIIIDKVVRHYVQEMMMKSAGRYQSHHNRFLKKRRNQVNKLVCHVGAIRSSHAVTGTARVVSGSKRSATHLVCLAEMRCTCITAVKRNAVCQHLEAAYHKFMYNQYDITNNDKAVNDSVNDSVNDGVNDGANDTADTSTIDLADGDGDAGYDNGYDTGYDTGDDKTSDANDDNIRAVTEIDTVATSDTVNDIVVDTVIDTVIDIVVDIVNDIIDTIVHNTRYTGTDNFAFNKPLYGGNATEAAVAILCTMKNSIHDVDAAARTCYVRSILPPAKSYFVDFGNRLCSCLHSQIYHYCAHLLHAAVCNKDKVTSTAIKEEMELVSVNSISIDYWRYIGREDKTIEFVIPDIDFSNNFSAEVHDGDFQYSNIGTERIRRIQKHLPMMLPGARATADDMLMQVETYCEQHLTVPTITPKVSVPHSGNRQDGDRIVKPLFPPIRKRASDREIATLQGVTCNRLMKVQKGKNGRANIATEITVEMQEYKDLPNATLSENVQRLATQQ
jgi:hypothetical protein